MTKNGDKINKQTPNGVIMIQEADKINRYKYCKTSRPF